MQSTWMDRRVWQRSPLCILAWPEGDWEIEGSTLSVLRSWKLQVWYEVQIPTQWGRERVGEVGEVREDAWGEDKGILFQDHWRNHSGRTRKGRQDQRRNGEQRRGDQEKDDTRIGLRINLERDEEEVEVEVEEEKKEEKSFTEETRTPRGTYDPNASWRKRELRDLLSLESTGSGLNGKNHDKYEHLIVNFDTGAAVSTVPRDDFEHLSFEKAQTTQYKTASGELLEDHGQVRLYGSDENYTNKTMNARVTDVHRILASGSELCKKNIVTLDSGGGFIVPSNSRAARKIRESILKEEECGVTKLRVERGVYVVDCYWVDHGKTEEMKGQMSGNSRQAKL